MEDAFKPLLSKGKETLQNAKAASLAAEKEKRKDRDEEIDQEIRSNFIFKVYCLLLSQLLIAVIMITFSLYSESFKYVLLNVRAVYIMFFIIAALTFVGPNFFPNILKLNPYNYIYLFTFTFKERFYNIRRNIFRINEFICNWKYDNLYYWCSIFKLCCNMLLLYCV